jgi:hypothetical protein
MSEVDFDKMKKVNAESSKKETTPKSKPQPEPEIEQPKTLLPEKVSGLFMADYIPSFAEMRLPRINIVQNIGDLQETFNPGAIVYERSAILFEHERKEVKGTKKLELVILCLLPRRYVERVEGGARGEIATSEEEVLELGGTTIYKEWEMKKADGMRYFEPFAEFVCLIKQPEHLHNDGINFPFEVDGSHYALGIWGMKSSAFNNCAKIVFGHRGAGAARAGYPTVLYSVSTKLRSFGAGKSAYIPVFVPAGRTSPAFQAFAHDLRVGAADAEVSGEAEE